MEFHDQYLHHLLGHKLLVEAVFDLDKLGVWALLDDFTLLEHNDIVGIADCRKPEKLKKLVCVCVEIQLVCVSMDTRLVCVCVNTKYANTELVCVCVETQ